MLAGVENSEEPKTTSERSVMLARMKSTLEDFAPEYT